MTNIKLISTWLEDNQGKTHSDIARLTSRDRRQVSDAIKRGHYLVDNSRGEYFMIPAIYIKAFE